MSTIVKEKIIEIKEKPSDVKRHQEIDKYGRSYATGKRKNAVAKVWIKKGTGKITVNGLDAIKYFGREILVNMVKAPFISSKNEDKFDVISNINGGGKSGQAGALAHGISKAITLYDPNSHKALRLNGFLTRDPRVVERKKYGYKKARKGQTYRKR